MLAMQEVKKEKKKRKSPVGFLLAILVFAFLIYSAVTIAGQSIQISQAREELAQLEQQLKIQELKNEDLKRVLELSDSESKEYKEQIARQELDYIAQGERVFVNISGD